MNDYDGLKSLIESPDFDLSELDTLSEQEKQILIQMINEFSDRGASSALKSIWYEDYDEIPVDIDTFIDDPHYFGSVLEGSVYPYWRDMLRELFAPDSKYFEVIFSCITGDTLIPCADGGLRNIYEIDQMIDYYHTVKLYSYDEDNDIMVENDCIGVIEKYKRNIYEVLLNNTKVLRATAEHKVLLDDGRWVTVSYLKEGMKLKSKTEDLFVVECKKTMEDEVVYDLVMKEPHHNFLTDTGMIVHNCSIGVGKSTIAGVGMAYVLHKLLCLKNPQSFYGLNKSSILTLNFFNINLQLAETVSYGKFQSLITKSPWFLEHGTLVGKGKPQIIPNKGIKLMFGSNSSHALGHDVFCLSGDTKIVTDKGIKAIEELENQAVKVWQYDKNKDETVLSNECTVVESGKVTEIIVIELEDDTELKCTPEHRIMLKDGSYKMAKDLTEDDELMFLDSIDQSLF